MGYHGEKMISFAMTDERGNIGRAYLHWATQLALAHTPEEEEEALREMGYLDELLDQKEN